MRFSDSAYALNNEINFSLVSPQATLRRHDPVFGGKKYDFIMVLKTP